MEQLSPGATPAEAPAVEPVLCMERSLHREQPAHSREQPCPQLGRSPPTAGEKPRPQLGRSPPTAGSCPLGAVQKARVHQQRPSAAKRFFFLKKEIWIQPRLVGFQSPNKATA